MIVGPEFIRTDFGRSAALTSAKNRLVLLLILAVAVLALFTGCGGGGDSGSTLDPDQLEVATAVDSFAAAIRAEDFAAADKYLDSNLKWYRTGNVTWDVATVRSRLQSFFAGAVVKDFTFSGVGVNMLSETLAEGRGLLTVVYTDVAGVEKPVISQNISFVMEKVPTWSLIEFGAYGVSDKGSAFPPEL